jgi:hypothetical protein
MTSSTDAPVFESTEVTLDEFSWLLAFVYALLATVFALVGLKGPGMLPFFGAPALAALVRGVGVTLPNEGRLRVDAEGLRWNDVLVASRDAIVGVVRTEAVVTVRVGAPSYRLLRFVAPDEQNASTFVRALGGDWEHSAVTLRLGSPFTRLPSNGYVAAVVVVGIAMIAAFGWGLTQYNNIAERLPFFSAGSVCLLLLFMAFAPSRVSLGSDGILVTWFGRRRWLSWHEVARVEPVPGADALVLITHTGEKFPLPTELALRFSEADAKPELASRIEACVRAANDTKRHLVSRRLARGERSMHQWISDLRALTRDTPGYRVKPVTREELLAVLRDSSAEEQLRIAAAVALAADGARDEVSREAETLASPGVRVALHDVATARDDDTLEAAIKAVEATRGGRY